MKLSTTTRSIALAGALAASLTLTACGAANETGGGPPAAGDSSAADFSGTLNGAGSSAQQAAMQAWTAGFSSQHPGVTVNYDPVGSGGGRQQFLSGGTAFAGSDAALSDAEVQQAKQRCPGGAYFELPDYISPIAVVYNLPGVKNLRLSPDTLAKIFTGAITTWNDPAVAADNPGATLPSTKITPVHRSDNSGTTENFTDYLHAVVPALWTNPKSGTWPLTGGEAGAQTAGLIAAVKAGDGAIGYADASQAGGLEQAKIKVGSDYAAPSEAAAAKVVAASPQLSGRGQYDHAITVKRDITAAGTYPIVLVSYHIGCIQYPDKATADIARAFFGYVISGQGQLAAAQAAGSAPIDDQLRQSVQPVVDAIKAGS